MKAVLKSGLTAVVCGMVALPAGNARANDIEDFFKRAHRSLVKRHKEIAGAHIGAAAAAAALAPRVGSVDVKIGAAPRHVVVPHGVHVRTVPHRVHICRKIQVKTWVAGYWEETIEQRWVSYRYRQGGYYEDVVVKHWVPGRYEYTWMVDPNCSCRWGTHRYDRGHRGPSYSNPGRHHGRKRHDDGHRDGRRR